MTNTEQTPNDHRPAGACQVQHTVRPGAEARWYCVSREGLATLCVDEADSKLTAANEQRSYPRSGPYRAVVLVEADEIDRLRALLLRQYRADAACYAMPLDCTEAEHVALLSEHDAVHALLAAEFKA